MSFRLIVGLGNPGQAYDHTRHNIGFTVLDAFAAQAGIGWVPKRRYQALIAPGLSPSGNRFTLLKPQTYMNLSGRSVAGFLSDKGLSAHDLLVLHDEMDLPLGKIKGAYNRGPAGHNGVRSLIEAIGTKEFYRLRLGIGKPPAEGISHVLGRFSPQEKKAVDDLVRHGVVAIAVALDEPWEALLLR